MDAKKDPGKFTIRFCMSEPRQRKAADVLNAQGRLKAQFLTNAILRYTASEVQENTAIEMENLKKLIKAAVAEELRGKQNGEVCGTPIQETTDELQSFDLCQQSAVVNTLRAFRNG